jgi:hypothetical protein
MTTQLETMMPLTAHGSLEERGPVDSASSATGRRCCSRRAFCNHVPFSRTPDDEQTVILATPKFRPFVILCLAHGWRHRGCMGRIAWGGWFGSPQPASWRKRPMTESADLPSQDGAQLLEAVVTVPRGEPPPDGMMSPGRRSFVRSSIRFDHSSSRCRC